ncbi:hypothetical protein Tco_0000175 [Tanacetum coccineum]
MWKSLSTLLPNMAKDRCLSLNPHLDLASCAIWKNLGYSEWSTPAGLKLARENLQSRVKEEDSITDVENAVLDLGVVNPLCLFFIDQRVLISFITELIKFIQNSSLSMNFPVNLTAVMISKLVSLRAHKCKHCARVRSEDDICLPVH